MSGGAPGEQRLHAVVGYLAADDGEPQLDAFLDRAEALEAAGLRE